MSSRTGPDGALKSQSDFSSVPHRSVQDRIANIVHIAMLGRVLGDRDEVAEEVASNVTALLQSDEAVKRFSSAYAVKARQTVLYEDVRHALAAMLEDAP